MGSWRRRQRRRRDQRRCRRARRRRGWRRWAARVVHTLPACGQPQSYIFTRRPTRRLRDLITASEEPFLRQLASTQLYKFAARYQPCTKHPHRSCQQGPRCAEALSTVPAGARDGQEGGEEAAQGVRAQRQGPRLRAPSPARSDLVGGRARAPRLTSRSYLRAYSLMTPHDNHM